MCFRIGDNEVQAIIDAQLADFESFGVRIPKTPEVLDLSSEVLEEDEEFEATTAMNDSEETTVKEVVIEDTTLIPESTDDQWGSGEIVSSEGDDMVINEQSFDDETKEDKKRKMRKIKKLKKSKE